MAAATGCRRAATPPKSEPASPAGAPSAAPPAPSLTPGGTVTPRMEPPTEARVLSAAFSAAARALRPSVVRIDVEIEHPRIADRGDDDDLAPFFRHFFGQGMPDQ